MADAAMTDAPSADEAQLDRAYDVLEKLTDCGLAPPTLREASLLPGAPACVAVRAAAASLAAALTALSRRLGNLPGGGWDGDAAAAAAGRLHTVCADETACGDGQLEAALGNLLSALDPDGREPLAQRLELFGAHPCRAMLAARS